MYYYVWLQTWWFNTIQEYFATDSLSFIIQLTKTFAEVEQCKALLFFLLSPPLIISQPPFIVHYTSTVYKVVIVIVVVIAIHLNFSGNLNARSLPQFILCFLTLTVTAFDCTFDFWAVGKWTQGWFLIVWLAAGDPHHRFCWLLLQLLPNSGYTHKLWFQWTRHSFFFVCCGNVLRTIRAWTESFAFLTEQYVFVVKCCTNTPPFSEYMNLCLKQHTDSQTLGQTVLGTCGHLSVLCCSFLMSPEPTHCHHTSHGSFTSCLHFNVS